MDKHKADIIIVTLIAFVFGSALTYGLMQWTRRIPASARVKTVGIGVYLDPNCTFPVTEIDWGLIEPSEEKTFSAYIKNESNVAVTLTMHTEEWMPTTASSFIHLSWNYDGKAIPLDESKPVSFILSVDAEIEGIDTFAFTIVIVGSG